MTSSEMREIYILEMELCRRRMRMIEDNLIEDILDKGEDMSKYWGVRVSEAISYQDINLTADTVEITEGNLVFKKSDGVIVFGVANTDWLCFYEADKKTKMPLVVEKWAPVERNPDEY